MNKSIEILREILEKNNMYISFLKTFISEAIIDKNEMIPIIDSTMSKINNIINIDIYDIKDFRFSFINDIIKQSCKSLKGNFYETITKCIEINEKFMMILLLNNMIDNSIQDLKQGIEIGFYDDIKIKNEVNRISSFLEKTLVLKEDVYTELEVLLKTRINSHFSVVPEVSRKRRKES
jgi:hypothetical protein